MITGQVLARRQETVDVTRGYFVLTPRLASVEAARELRAELEQRGVRDIAVLLSEPNRGQLSLGLFSTREAAESRRESLAALLVEAEIEPRKVSTPQYWLDVETTADHAAAAPWQDAVPKVGASDCPDRLYVAKAASEP